MGFIAYSTPLKTQTICGAWILTRIVEVEAAGGIEPPYGALQAPA